MNSEIHLLISYSCFFLYSFFLGIWLFALLVRTTKSRIQHSIKKTASTSSERVAVIIPVSVLNEKVYQLLNCLQQQDHGNFEIVVVFEAGQAPDDNTNNNKIRYIYNSQAEKSLCSNKVSNLLLGLRSTQNADILIFIDDDISVKSDFITEAARYILHWPESIITSYRYVDNVYTFPQKVVAFANNLIAFLGIIPRWQCVWGGCFALHSKLAEELRLEEIWAKSISDDLDLTYAARSFGTPITVIIDPLSYSSIRDISWMELISWSTRQLRLSRFWAPKEFRDTFLISFSWCLVTLSLVSTFWHILPVAGAILLISCILVFAPSYKLLTASNLITSVIASIITPLLVLFICCVAATGGDLTWKGRIYHRARSQRSLQ